MKGGKTQTTTTAPDPASQAYIQQMRGMAGGAANVATQGPQGGGSWMTGPISPDQIQQAMSPYLQNVIGGVRGEFDHLRSQAGMQTGQDATMAGAFGGSRHGVAEGVRMGELDRAQTSQIGGLLNQGYGQALGFAEHQRGLQERQLQEPLWRQQQGLQMMNMGMGPVGQTQTTPMQSNKWGAALGGATAGSAFGPWGAAAGGLGGLLFG